MIANDCESLFGAEIWYLQRHPDLRSREADAPDLHHLSHLLDKVLRGNRQTDTTGVTHRDMGNGCACCLAGRRMSIGDTRRGDTCNRWQRSVRAWIAGVPISSGTMGLAASRSEGVPACTTSRNPLAARIIFWKLSVCCGNQQPSANAIACLDVRLCAEENACRGNMSRGIEEILLRWSRTCDEYATPHT